MGPGRTNAFRPIMYWRVRSTVVDRAVQAFS